MPLVPSLLPDESAGAVVAVVESVSSVVESVDAVELEPLLDSSAFDVVSSSEGQPASVSTIVVEIKRLSIMARTIANLATHASERMSSANRSATDRRR
jgi:hypothetical protein